MFNATFNSISDIVAVSFIGGGNQSTRRKPPRGGQFYWWRKPEYPEKTTDFGLVYSVSRNFQQYFSYMIRLRLWCLTPLSTIFQLYRGSVLLVEETGVPYFSYILAVSFIGGGNQSTWRKPLTCFSFIGGGNRSTQRKPPTCH